MKSSAKYGYVNRKLTQTTPTKEENRPKLYSQGYNTDRDIEETLRIGWKLLSILPRSELKRIDEKYLDLYYGKE